MSTRLSTSQRRSTAAMVEAKRGWLYAIPDWLFIIVLFFVPIVLLVVMACSRWGLMGGNRGINFPDNFIKVFSHPLLGHAVLFTLEYTVLVTAFLLALGLGLALIVQESTKWNNMLRTCFLLPSATGLASASLLFYAMYSPQVGPVTKILNFFGLMDSNGSVLSTGQSALWATIIVIVWRFFRLLHASDDDRLAVNSGGFVRGGAHGRCRCVAYLPFRHIATNETDHCDVLGLLRDRLHSCFRSIFYHYTRRSEQFHAYGSATHL